MSRSRDDVFAALLAELPDGSQDLYKLGKTDAIGGTLWSIAGGLLEITSQIDSLRLGIPSKIVATIPEWESACGLSQTATARSGTTAERRNAVLAILRQRGSFARDDIRAAIQPYFLYANPGDIVINEPDCPALQIAHTYSAAGGPWNCVPSNTIDIVVAGDEAPVSQAGALITINLTCIASLAELEFSLRSPDGFIVQKGPLLLSEWGESSTAEDFRVYFPEMRGRKTDGTWKLTVKSPSGPTTANAVDLFVEGVGNVYNYATTPPTITGQGLGATKFTWDVTADPLLLGVGYDLVGALRVLQRIKPAHTLASIT